MPLGASPQDQIALERALYARFNRADGGLINWEIENNKQLPLPFHAALPSAKLLFGKFLLGLLAPDNL